MAIRNVRLAGASIAGLILVSAAAAQPLPTDPRLVTGELPNGMKYIVLQHPNPAGRAVMWMNVSTGSLNETDKQRGIAHYLEHMAFNGSEHFPPGSVIPFFQSMGLTFGQHQNAFTSFEQTTYQLSFPNTKSETLEQGMKFFGDVAGKLALLPGEIDEERQIILEEKRTRAGGRQRVQDYIIQRTAPGSLIGERLPIGVDETLMSVQKPDFEAYYGKYYVPSNMTIMVVADADPAPIVEQIRKSFGAGERVPVPQDQDPRVTPYQTNRAIIATDAELTSVEVQVVKIDKAHAPTTTVPQLRDDLLTQIGSSVFNRRIREKMSKVGTKYQGASGSVQDQPGIMRSIELSATGKPADWKTLLTELGEDMQRARLHGFTQRELDNARTDIISDAERSVEQEKTTPAARTIARMNGSVAAGEPIMSASQELDLLKTILPTITVQEISKRFADNFDPTNVTFVLSGPPTTPELPTEAELVSFGRTALDVKPEAKAEEARATALMTELPKAGKVQDAAEHAASKVTSAWLSNGARVHYRFMDTRKDEVNISVSLAAGSIQETAKNRGVSDVAALAWRTPATSKLSSTDIRDLMVGKKVRVGGGGGFGGGRGGRGGGGGGGGDDSMSLTISGSPADLEIGMQLAYLMLTDPVIEPASFERWKEGQARQIEARAKDPQAAFIEIMASTVYPPTEVRTQPLTTAQVNALTIDAAQAWLRNAIAKAPMEVSIVGDIPQDRAMELVSKYLASLPSRDRITDKTLDESRTLTRRKGPIVNEREMATQTDKAIVMIGFYGPDETSVTDSRLMNMASRIVSTRMIEKVREAEQLAYSPRAGLQPGSTYPGFGVFMAFMPTDPPKVARLVEVVGQMYDEFAKNGPTEEELTVAKKQIANTLDEQMKEPGYWTGVTSEMDYHGRKLDDVMAAADFYQAVTADQMKLVFAKYCKPETSLRAVMKPAPKVEEKPTGG